MEDYQVGVFPYTKDGEVVLVTTRSGGYWVFPKGRCEKGHSNRSVAESEAFEEAGLLGKLGADYMVFNTNSSKAFKLRLYPMRVKEVLSHWPEHKERKRVIVSIKKAEKLLEKDLALVLKKMAKKCI